MIATVPRALLICSILLWCTVSHAQEIEILPDSLAAKQGFDYTKRFSPRKAIFFAAVLPGMGQAYNKKYWKIPIIYSGFGLGIYVMNFYQGEYAKYRTELLDNLSTNAFPSNPSNLSEATLRRVVDFYRRKRDYTIVLLGVGYLLQMVDAHVDAHLKEFRYNPNLKVRVRPEVSQDIQLGQMAGVALTVKF